MVVDLSTYKAEDLYRRVDQHAAFEHFLGRSVPIGRKFSNPLRHDPNPSAILKWRGDRLVLTDYGDARYNGDVLDIVQYHYSTSYKEAYDRITSEVKSGNYIIPPAPKRISNKFPIDILEAQPFTVIDREYWKQFGISIPTLIRYGVKSCKRIMMGNVIYSYADANPIYAYLLDDGSIKVLRPFESPENKWRYNGSGFTCQGWSYVNFNNPVLFICKSWKDCMFLLQRGYNAVCFQSEGLTVFKDVDLQKINRFKKVIVFYDRDATGVRSAREIVKRYGWEFIFVPKYLKSKDLTDCYRLHGITTKVLIEKKVMI